MDAKTNTCIEHDWTRSLEESATEVCAWPGCQEKRDAKEAGDVDAPAHVVMVTFEQGRRAA